VSKLLEINELERSGKLNKIYEAKRREFNEFSYSKVIEGTDDWDFTQPFDFVDKYFPPTNESLFDSKMPRHWDA